MGKIKKVEFEVKEDNTQQVIKLKDELVEKAMMECGFDMERFAKEQLYPSHGKVTGRLQNSITFATTNYHSKGNDCDGVKADAEEMELHGTPEKGAVYVGTNVEYAPPIELGSTKRGGYHFLKKAIQDHLSEYKDIIEKTLTS